MTWVVIYGDTETDEIFAWLCRAEEQSEAKDKFRQEVFSDRKILTVEELSKPIEHYFLFTEWKN